MLKRIVLFFTLVFWLQDIEAQSDNKLFYPKFERGYIELKDGRTIKGQYIYSPELDRIRISTGDESFVLDASEVVRITKKKPVYKESENEFTQPDAPEVKHFFIFSELGVLPGNPDNINKRPLTFHISVNYLFSGKLSGGVGVGVEFYKETYLPITINGLYKFFATRVTPFTELQAGYQIPIEGSRTKVVHLISAQGRNLWPHTTVPHDTELKAKGGFLFNPSLGVIWQNNSNMSFAFSAGYRFHRLRYNNKEKEYNLNIDYNRLSLKIGLIF